MIDVTVTGSVELALLDSARQLSGREANKKNVEKQIHDFLKFLNSIASSVVWFIKKDIVYNFNYIVFNYKNI